MAIKTLKYKILYREVCMKKIIAEIMAEKAAEQLKKSNGNKDSQKQ